MPNNVAIEQPKDICRCSCREEMMAMSSDSPTVHVNSIIRLIRNPHRQNCFVCGIPMCLMECMCLDARAKRLCPKSQPLGLLGRSNIPAATSSGISFENDALQTGIYLTPTRWSSSQLPKRRLRSTDGLHVCLYICDHSVARLFSMVSNALPERTIRNENWHIYYVASLATT